MNDSEPDTRWCPECASLAEKRPPLRWPDSWGPKPRYSHADGSPLCPIATVGGYQPCLPVRQRPQVLPVSQGRPSPPLPARWCAALMARTADDLYTAVMCGDRIDVAELLRMLTETMRAVNALTEYAETRIDDRGLTATARRATQATALTEATYAGLAALHAAHACAKRGKRQRPAATGDPA